MRLPSLIYGYQHLNSSLLREGAKPVYGLYLAAFRDFYALAGAE